MSCVIRHRSTNHGNCSNHRHRRQSYPNERLMITAHLRGSPRRRRALSVKRLHRCHPPLTENELKSVFRRTLRR